MFKKLFALGDRYAEQITWKDFALLKFCICSIGLMIGTFVPKTQRKKVICVSAGVFAVTYIPLMTKLFSIALKKE